MLPRDFVFVRFVAVLAGVLMLVPMRAGRVRMLNLSLRLSDMVMRSMSRAAVVIHNHVPTTMSQCHQQSVSGQDRPAEERGKGQTTHYRLRWNR
jgi:hypothetical protein